MAMYIGLPWHSGEDTMHRLLRVPDSDNPTSPMLTPHANAILQQSPLLAVGALDSEGRPWTTVWGGAAGFSKYLGSSIIAVRTPVDKVYDPVVQSLRDVRSDKDGQGKMIGGLAINLMRRTRVKLFGRMETENVSITGDRDANPESGRGEIKLLVRIEQSLGNCPKYLNRKKIREATPAPKLLSNGPVLSQESLDLLNKADIFFISTRNGCEDMDTNNRGGPPGFVRVLSNDSSGAVLIYPEYSGNRLYQSLGNLQKTPLAGLVFPDFETGDVLYMTGTTEVLIGNDAATVMPHSNLAVKIKLSDARLVKEGLPFKGTADEPSPYNPSVRLLSSEGSLASKLENQSVNIATLVEKQLITPTISRFRFALERPATYKAGQWVAFDFSSELDIGYSHMRDDDPRSLNDDFVRTFTVSSPPVPVSGAQNHFEITIRRLGPVTSFLFSRLAYAGLEVPVQGFGGDFRIEQGDGNEITPFVAGGVGITPLLAQFPTLDASKLRLLWTLHADDINFALDIVRKHPKISSSLTLFVTSGAILNEKQTETMSALKELKVQLHQRRLNEDDLLSLEAQKWYICTGTGLRRTLLHWLEGKSVIYEDFNF